MLLLVLMILFGVGAVVLLGQAKKGVAGARPAAVVCAALTVALAVSRLVVGGGDQQPNTMEAFARYQGVCGTYLGQDLAQRHPGARAVILIPPHVGGSQELISGRELLVASLEAALEAGGVTVQIRETTIPEDMVERSRMEPSDVDDSEAQTDMAQLVLMEYATLYDAGRLSEVLAELEGEADLVVCTLDFADRVEPGSLPQAGSAPSLVLLNVWAEDLEQLLKETVLEAVVVYQSIPDAWRDAIVPEDIGEAFHKRFVLVTEENVASLKGTHPQI